MVEPDGRRLLRLEVRNSQVPIERKPPWIRTTMRTGPEFRAIRERVAAECLHTRCTDAGGPNGGRGGADDTSASTPFIVATRDGSPWQEVQVPPGGEGVPPATILPGAPESGGRAWQWLHAP